HLGGALEQARMKVEHVARVGFAARRTTQQQRHLAVGNGLLRKVVIDDDRVHAVVAEILAHGAAAKRRQILHGRGVGRGRSDDDGIIKRALLFEDLHKLGNRRAFLPYRDINAVELDLLIRLGVQRLLIKDGIERNCGLAGLTVADDQLALATADRDQSVDGFQAGGHWVVHGFARNNARRFHIDARTLLCLDWPFAVDRVAKRINHPAKQTLADRHIDDGAGTFDGLTFLDFAVVAENDDADVCELEIECHTAHAVLEFNQFASLHIVETIDSRNAVADGEHLADFGDFSLLAEVLDLLFQNGGNFCGADIHQRTSFIASLIELSLVRSELSTIRLPTLTISPPIMVGSILTSRSMSLPPVTHLS